MGCCQWPNLGILYGISKIQAAYSTVIDGVQDDYVYVVVWWHGVRMNHVKGPSQPVLS